MVDGVVRLNEAPGLGVSVCENTIREYLVNVEIKVNGQTLYAPLEI